MIYSKCEHCGVSAIEKLGGEQYEEVRNFEHKLLGIHFTACNRCATEFDQNIARISEDYRKQSYVFSVEFFNRK